MENKIKKAIEHKLKQVEEFEAKYGPNDLTRSWRKWCTDQEYREREKQFRHAIAASVKPNVNYL